MAQENITPEEKLLKLIENPLAQKQKIHPALKARGAKSGGSWFGGLHIDKNTFVPVDLQTVNKIAAMLCVLFTVVFIFDFTRLGAELKNRFEQISSNTTILEEKEKDASSLKFDLIEILAQSKKRNIFTFLPPKEAVVVPTANTAEAISSLKLVGIIWSQKPQAMIESIKENKTYLLSAGEKIGDLNIKSVLRDRVVLGKDEREWELR